MALGDVEQTMARLAARRPIFHSEADFQHAFAWQLQTDHPDARIRLETRPRPGVRLDVLTVIDDRRVAYELKYLLRNVTTRLTASRSPFRIKGRKTFAATTLRRTSRVLKSCSAAAWPTRDTRSR
jgi:hypothetical protein